MARRKPRVWEKASVPLRIISVIGAEGPHVRKSRIRRER